MHRLKFENRFVRVFDILLAPGDETSFHTHVNDGLGIRITDAQIRDSSIGGAPQVIRVERGSVSFAQYSSPLAHRVSNIGTTPFRNIFIEVLASASAFRDWPAVQPGERTVILVNERVRVLRRIIAPGELVELHFHLFRGPMVALSDGKIEIGVPGERIRTVQIRAGDTQWIEVGTKHSLKNVGTAPFEVIDVELK